PKTPKVPGTKAWDTDMDGCSDKEELGNNELFGGLRDPYNKWDFYDAVGGDQTVDLFNDIFGVAFAFGQGKGDPLYTEALDRGGNLVGSNVWNQDQADKTIDLFNDIFGVAFQFGHTCS
ncbi:MAG: flexitail domain-containing putative surface protein, partial [Dehalococcoidia bacterium]